MRTNMKTMLVVGALLLPGLCPAQGISGYGLNGPSLGIIFDPHTAALRPILGIPGAATLGRPLISGFTVSRAFVAPGGDFALVVARDNARLVVLPAAGGAARWLTSASHERPDLVEFSPRGGSAAIYYRASGRLMVFSGLRDDTPRLVAVDTSSITGAPSQVAVSEDGGSLLLAVPEGGAAALYYLPVARATNQRDAHGRALPGDAATGVTSDSVFARRLGSFQSVSGLKFAGNSADGLVADGKAGSAYLIQDVPGVAHISALGTQQDGLAEPAAIEAMDARRILVADSAGGKLTILYRDATPAVSIQCECTPAGLYRLPGNSVYRLTNPSNEPMWLLDAGGSEARIVAVPPGPSERAAAVNAEGAQR